jgi:5,10-methylene-tetrahydrofolate dehydrogenase/methenyl tetrahydrofolate cyclohydrolase
VLDGKAVAAAWSEQLQQHVPELSQALGRPPGLAVVLVGSRPDSMLYVTKKEEACTRIGINCRCAASDLSHCLHCLSSTQTMRIASADMHSNNAHHCQYST